MHTASSNTVSSVAGLSANPFLSCLPAVSSSNSFHTAFSSVPHRTLPRSFFAVSTALDQHRAGPIPQHCAVCAASETPDKSTKTVISFSFFPLTPFHYTTLAIHKEMTCLVYVYWYIPAHAEDMFFTCIYCACMYAYVQTHMHGMYVEAREQFLCDSVSILYQVSSRGPKCSGLCCYPLGHWASSDPDFKPSLYYVVRHPS